MGLAGTTSLGASHQCYTDHMQLETETTIPPQMLCTGLPFSPAPGSSQMISQVKIGKVLSSRGSIIRLT